MKNHFSQQVYLAVRGIKNSGPNRFGAPRAMKEDKRVINYYFFSKIPVPGFLGAVGQVVNLYYGALYR